MSTLKPEQLPLLAAALIRLRGDTLNSLGTVTGIRTANLSVWLRGKEQVISAKRITGLMYHLGVEGARLRSDVLHQWHDTGLLDDVKNVLAKLIDSKATVWLFQDTQPGLTKTRFLRVGDAWIRVELSPAMGEAKDFSEMVNAGRVLTLPTMLAGIPSGSLQAVQDELLTMAEQVAFDLGDQDLLESLMLRMREIASTNATANISSPAGWTQLEHALQFALERDVDPAEIATLIQNAYPK